MWIFSHVSLYSDSNLSQSIYPHSIIVQVYFKNTHEKFPAGGKLSQYVDNMKIGDTIDFRGPSGKLEYLGYGMFSIKVSRKEPPVKIHVKKVAMIAGRSF